MSDLVWQTLIGGSVTVVLAYMEWRTKQAVVITAAAAAEKAEEVKEAAKVAASKVEEVKRTLAKNATDTNKTLAGLVEVTDKTHALVNSRLGVALKAAASALRQIADLTQKSNDYKAAEAAEKTSQEHDAQQFDVDQGKRIMSEEDRDR